MARYTGPKTRVARKFGEPIFGPDKHLERKNFPPGQHGMNKKRKKTSEYGVQLRESRRLNILTAYWSASSGIHLRKLQDQKELQVKSSFSFWSHVSITPFSVSEYLPQEQVLVSLSRTVI